MKLYHATIFRKRKSKLSKILKIDQNISFKVGRWKHFRKWFWSYLKVKNDCFEGSTVIFSTYFVSFWGTKLKPFVEKANQSLQDGFILKFARESILEISFEATSKSKTDVLSVWKWIFKFFCTFFNEQVENVFGGKRGKAYKTV